MGPHGPWDLVDIPEGIGEALPLSSPLLSIQCWRGSHSLPALTSQVAEHVVVVQLEGLSTITLSSKGLVSVFCTLEEGHCVVLPSLQHSRNHVFMSAQSSNSLVMAIAVLKTGTVRKAIESLSPMWPAPLRRRLFSRMATIASPLGVGGPPYPVSDGQ